MGTSSIEDPKRELEVVIAYLRLGLREGGIQLDVKGGHELTPQLRGLVGRGDMAMMRPDRSTKRRTNRVLTTPQGIDRLADYDRRYGEDLGGDGTIPTLRNDRARR